MDFVEDIFVLRYFEGPKRHKNDAVISSKS